ncbi:phage tail assembly protein [Pseudomonas lalucatii]|nr:phage tail assembly protein [Pseudomonas lalucatii]
MQTFTVTGTLPRGIKISGVTYTAFTMREPFLEDLIDAAAEAGGTGNDIAFYAEQAVRQLTEVKSVDGQEFKGPFVRSMIKAKADFIALRDAQVRLDMLGNGEPSASEATGT